MENGKWKMEGTLRLMDETCPVEPHLESAIAVCDSTHATARDLHEYSCPI